MIVAMESPRSLDGAPETAPPSLARKAAPDPGGGGRFVVLSLLYLLFRRALAVASLRVRSREFKELEIVVLRHELAVPETDSLLDPRSRQQTRRRLRRGVPRRGRRNRPHTVSGAEGERGRRALGRRRPRRPSRLATECKPQAARARLRVYAEHYNHHRPHRALSLRPPAPKQRLHVVSSHSPDRIHRRDRLGGLIHDDVRAA